jgi:hypothetical protein
MQTRTRLLLIVSLELAVGSVACTSTSADQPRVWGSDQASLTIADSAATVHILASGGCYGSYGEIQQIPVGVFAIPGTYTQLIGAYPGKIQYAAQYSGTIVGQRMSLTITVAALQRAFGPYSLASGVIEGWPACLYP